MKKISLWYTKRVLESTRFGNRKKNQFDISFDLHLNIRLSNNREAGDLRRHRAHYEVIVMHESGKWWRLVSSIVPNKNPDPKHSLPNYPNINRWLISVAAWNVCTYRGLLYWVILNKNRRFNTAQWSICTQIHTCSCQPKVGSYLGYCRLCWQVGGRCRKERVCDLLSYTYIYEKGLPLSPIDIYEALPGEIGWVEE